MYHSVIIIHAKEDVSRQYNSAIVCISIAYFCVCFKLFDEPEYAVDESEYAAKAVVIITADLGLKTSALAAVRDLHKKYGPIKIFKHTFATIDSNERMLWEEIQTDEIDALDNVSIVCGKIKGIY